MARIAVINGVECRRRWSFEEKQVLVAATALAWVGVLEFEAAQALAIKSGDDALIAALKLEILKLRHALYGTRAEGKSRLLDQLELQLEELEANDRYRADLGVCAR